eukprot:Hpha_TRINITY_DN11728_c1_g1::TRINITY_DN11728_c1_g1_i1::g.31875::m.31875
MRSTLGCFAAVVVLTAGFIPPSWGYTSGNLQCLGQVYGRCEAAWRAGKQACEKCIEDNKEALSGAGCEADDFFAFCINAAGVEPAAKNWMHSGSDDEPAYQCTPAGEPTPTGFACKELKPKQMKPKSQWMTKKQCLLRCVQPYACDESTGKCNMVPPGAPAHSSKPNCETTCEKREEKKGGGKTGGGGEL